MPLGGSGDWEAFARQGVVNYATEAADGSYLAIGCDDTHADARLSGIAFAVGGRDATFGEEVTLLVDGDYVGAALADVHGSIPTTTVDEQAFFEDAWAALRRGREAVLVLEDGTQARFSLRGSAATLPPVPCPTYFSTIQPMPEGFWTSEPPALRAFLDALAEGEAARADAMMLPRLRRERPFGGLTTAEFLAGIDTTFETRSVWRADTDMIGFGVAYRFVAGNRICDGEGFVILTQIGDAYAVNSLGRIELC